MRGGVLIDLEESWSVVIYRELHDSFGHAQNKRGASADSPRFFSS